MIRIVDWAVRRPTLILSMLVIVILAGVSAYINIPKEADPDIPIPYIQVVVPYPGISPEDAERLIIRPMETYLRSVEGVKEITAIGREGSATIALEFDVNFERQKALNDVRAQVDIARGEIPAEAEEPIVYEFNANLFPIITVALSGDVPERTLLQAAKRLEQQLKSIPSVLDVDMGGQREEQLEIVIDPAKLESYGLTQTEMFNAVRLNNQLIPAGTLDVRRGSFAVKVPGLFETAEDVLRLPLRATAEGVVTLQDIAEVRRTFLDATSYVYVNGKPAISLDVSKRAGENIIETSAAVRAAVEEAGKQMPEGIHVDILSDASDWIYNSLGSLNDSIILAIILVMIVVVAALGLRSGLLVGVAIPTSFLIAFLTLSMMGMTLNMMIQFGMVLAVGILVDGAIIVVEYADRKMAEGLDKREAFAAAGKRMFWPVVSATATMLGAFLPMLLWPGVAGKYMSYFPITLIFVLSASLFVALIFLPVLGGRFGKPSHHDVEHRQAIEASETGDWRTIPGVTGWYARMAERFAAKPGKVIAASGGVAFLVILLFMFFNHGVEFFVETEPEEAAVLVSARGNLSAEEKRDLVREVEKIVATMDGIKSIYTRTGGGGQTFGAGAVPADNIGRINVALLDYKLRRPGRQILDDIRKRTRDLPGIKVEVRGDESGPSGGKSIIIRTSGNNYGELLAVTAKIRAHLESLEGVRDVEDTRPLPGIQWALKIDREQASRFGADVVTVGSAVQLITNGIKIGSYRPDDAEDEVDIRVRYPVQWRNIDQLGELRVATREGLVPVSNFVRLVPEQQVNKIARVDLERIYEIRAATETGVLPNDIIAKMEQWIEEQKFPDSVRVNFAGANEQQDESMAFLGFAGLAAMFLIAMVLLTMFNSIYHSVLILTAVLLAIIGSLLGMVVMGQAFSVIMTGTGMLALAGIVVNHNIVLIDTYHRLVDSGMDKIEAVIRSSVQRLRPVFLTTVTAVLGLLPMMLALEIDFASREIIMGAPAAKWWVQLSTAIVFGLVLSKGITLGLMPALLAFPTRWRQKRAARKAKRAARLTLQPAE